MQVVRRVPRFAPKFYRALSMKSLPPSPNFNVEEKLSTHLQTFVQKMPIEIVPPYPQLKQTTHIIFTGKLLSITSSGSHSLSVKANFQDEPTRGSSPLPRSGQQTPIREGLPTTSYPASNSNVAGPPPTPPHLYTDAAHHHQRSKCILHCPPPSEKHA